MKAYISDKRPEKAIRSFDQMRTRGIQPDARIYRHLMSAYIEDQNPNEAIHLFNWLKSEGFQLSSILYSMLMNAYILAERPNDAIEAYQDMPGEIKINDMICNNLMRAYINAGRPNDAIRVYRDMPGEIKDNVVTHNILMYAYIVSGQPQFAFMAFMGMPEKVQPNEITFSSLLDGLMKHGMLERAREVYQTCDLFEGVIAGEVHDTFDCHFRCYGVVCMILDSYLRNKTDQRPLLVITGKGLHSHRERLFEMQDTVVNFIEQYHSGFKVEVDASNEGRVYITPRI